MVRRVSGRGGGGTALKARLAGYAMSRGLAVCRRDLTLNTRMLAACRTRAGQDGDLA